MSIRNPYYARLEGIPNNTAYIRFKRTIYATLIFTASYIIAVYIDKLSVYGSAVSFGYEPTLTFWNVSNLPSQYQDWSKQRVMLIFTIGTISLLLTTFVILFVYRKISRSNTLVRLLSLWTVLNCLALIGANIATSLFGFEDYSSLYFNNFSVVFLWWGIPKFLLYVMMLIYAVILFIAGYFIANRLLRLSHSQRLVKKYYGRLQIITQFYVIPFFAGGLLLLPFSINNILFIGFHMISLTLILVGMIARINDFYELHGIHRVDILSGPIWILVVLACLFLLPVLNG